MTMRRARATSRPRPPTTLADLRTRLAEAEATLHAIRHGEVDAVVIAGRHGRQVFTLEGAEHVYRMLIESINEGALTLTADQTILYANHCFARMVGWPLEQVTGGSLHRYLARADLAAFRRFLGRLRRAGGKIQVWLQARDGTRLPVQISVRPLAANGDTHATFGVVVTDLSESRRTEEQLRALTQRVVQLQEAERERVARELHDHITQLLCAALFRSQALAASLSTQNGAARLEATKLRVMLGHTAAEVERISRGLRPSGLAHLGLAIVVRQTSSEFAQRTGLRLRLRGMGQALPLTDDTRLALFRILQEALKNIEDHARARRVTVAIRRLQDSVVLTIADDGVGFDTRHHEARRKGNRVLGLMDMDQRAAHVGGTLTVKSGPRAGTVIAVRVPLPAEATSPN